MSGQLDIFHQPEPDPVPFQQGDRILDENGDEVRVTVVRQLTELAGTTWEDAFGNPPEAA